MQYAQLSPTQYDRPKIAWVYNFPTFSSYEEDSAHLLPPHINSKTPTLSSFKPSHNLPPFLKGSLQLKYISFINQ